MKIKESNKTPLVYIIMPCYNSEKYLLEQLMSIYYQSYMNWYLIFVNDGSLDSSEDIAQSFVSNYKLEDKVKIITKKNWWVNSAIQKWLEEVKKMCDIYATDSLISFCDSDDIWTKNKLEVQVKYMLDNPECWLSYHDVSSIDENWCLIHASITRPHLDESFFSFAIIWDMDHIISTETMFRINLVDDLLPLPTWFWMYQDYWMCLVFSIMEVNIHYISKQLAYYRRWHESLVKKAENAGMKKRHEAEVRNLILIQEKFPDKDISYFISFRKDYLLNRCYYSKVHCILLILFKYPKVFCFLLRYYFKVKFLHIFNKK